MKLENNGNKPKYALFTRSRWRNPAFSGHDFVFLVKVLCLKVAFDSFLKNAHTFQMEKTGKHRHCSNKLGKKHEKKKQVLVISEKTKLLVQFTKVMSKESTKVTNESKNVTHS